MAKRDERITRFDLQTFGQRFREERHHWDDGELGECMTLTPSAIAEIEAGKVNPDGYLIFKMAACGLDIQYIITGVRSGNAYDVAASIGRFDEFELEERALTPAEIAVAEAMTHKPIWSNGHRPKWWSHIGVRAVLTSAHRQMTLEGAMQRVRHLFGSAQVPSSSSVHRYWQRLDALYPGGGRLMCDADRAAVLAFFSQVRRDRVPGGQTRPASATARYSAKNGPSPMAKVPAEIDGRNPFIPSVSPVCRFADLVMMFFVTLSAVAAGVALLLAQF